MPLQNIVIEGKRAWGLWEISESEHDFQALLGNGELAPPNLTNSEKRQEWYGGRLLTQALLERQGLPFSGIIKDEYGKPFLKGNGGHISLSHSFPYVAAIIDNHYVGIDLEQPKAKLLRVAPRVLTLSEQSDAGTDIVKHCVYWCSKEALIKIYGKKDLTLSENLKIEPFRLENEGYIIGKIIVNQMERVIPLYYKVFSGFVVVFNKQRDPNLTL